MARTMNGDYIPKYDAQTDNETKAMLKNINDQINTLTAAIKQADSVNEDLSKRVSSLERIVQWEFRNDITRIDHRLNTHDLILSVLARILTSGLVRFLNLFGRWFSYKLEEEEIDGVVYQVIEFTREDKKKVMFRGTSHTDSSDDEITEM